MALRIGCLPGIQGPRLIVGREHAYGFYCPS
jgi:hypothetical protein